MQQFGFDLELATTGRCRLHGSDMGLGRDSGGTLHQVDFGGVLDQPHFIEQGMQVVGGGRRVHAGAGLRAH
jgi:hypothetical protein